MSTQAGLKTKKATESYKSYVEKYAVAKTDFEQKMSETAQVTVIAEICVVLTEAGLYSLGKVERNVFPPVCVWEDKLFLVRVF